MFRLFSFYRPLDRLQESVLSIIPPSNLYDILATDLQKKIDQKNAAIIEENLYKHLSEETRVGVRKYLIETRLKEINDERRYSPISILVILASLALFFFSSIGEGLIQDLFLDKVKAFLCWITGSLFCK